jgi:splicing factor 3B subunit 3
MLTLYELDLGLNHIVRKWSAATDFRANLLVRVPGGEDGVSNHFVGPSGVLVCCEDYIIYSHMDKAQHRVPIPRRDNPLQDPKRGLLIVTAVMHKVKVSLTGSAYSSFNGANTSRNRILSLYYSKAKKETSTW